MSEEKVKSEDKQVAKKTSTALASLGASFEVDSGKGLENVSQDDLTIPRLKILQALSPEVNKRDGGYIEGAAAGDVVNTVTKQLYTEDNPLIVLPVAYKRMYLEWQPRESGGGLVNQHTDASILAETKKDERYADVLPNGNYIQTSATHYVLTIEGDSFQQVMIPMANTQLKKSRTWNSVMSSIKLKGSEGNVYTPPSYSHKYKLTTVQESNDRGTWFGWNIDLIGIIEESELHLYEIAKGFAETVNVDAPPASTASPDEAPF
tara:strand:- start:16459 stop:17247 length:789 start_codon:yes stop_codon:yes gene_type:complete